MKILFLITARAGSKRLPGKNLKLLNGKPLISYAIEQAMKISEPNDICISTDDEAVIRLAGQYGLNVPFTRPAHLATDQSSSYDVIKHAVAFYESQGHYYDAIILLQPTSPFRRVDHINDVIELLKKNQHIEMVVSVKVTSSNPYFNLFEENNEGYLIKSKASDFTRHQDCPEVYEYNGAIYGIHVHSLKMYSSLSSFSKIKKYVMDDLHSIDIDSPLDWTFCAFLTENKIIVPG